MANTAATMAIANQIDWHSLVECGDRVEVHEKNSVTFNFPR